MFTVVTPPTAPDRRASRPWTTDEAAIDRWTNEGGAHSRREIEMTIAELTTVSSAPANVALPKQHGSARGV